jgi:hypothetical protein
MIIHPPTKLQIHSITSPDVYYVQASCEDISKALMKIPEFIQIFKYDFVFEMPSVIYIKDEPKIETYINWRGKQKEKEVYPKYPYTIYLSFSKELTEKELEFWRIWKLGYLCRLFYNHPS